MFRVNEIEITDEIVLLKLEGDITKQKFNESISEILKRKIESRKVILDFCGVTYISPDVIERLAKIISKEVLFLNCGTRLKNILRSQGLVNNLIS